MKAHAKIRFNIYINIDAIGVAEYFLWILWKILVIGCLASSSLSLKGTDVIASGETRL